MTALEFAIFSILLSVIATIALVELAHASSK
jgi:hypothetical protein